MFDWIFMKIADNLDRHKVLDKFEFQQDWTVHFGVTCLWVPPPPPPPPRYKKKKKHCPWLLAHCVQGERSFVLHIFWQNSTQSKSEFTQILKSYLTTFLIWLGGLQFLMVFASIFPQFDQLIKNDDYLCKTCWCKWNLQLLKFNCNQYLNDPNSFGQTGLSKQYRPRSAVWSGSTLLPFHLYLLDLLLYSKTILFQF